MYKQGTPFYGERSWLRKDEFLPTGNHDLVFVTGPDDHSPIHKHGYENNYAGYDPRCSCCWLGFAHSEAYHQQRILDGGAPAKIRLKGILQTGQVWLNNEPLPLEPSLKLRNHSPTGFSWGYMGSGPSQLALAVMLAIYGPERAQDCYMRFKEEVIARLPQTDFDLELDLS